MYNDLAQSHSSMELLNHLREDLKLLLDNPHNHWELNEDNILPMLASIDELKERVKRVVQVEDDDGSH